MSWDSEQQSNAKDAKMSEQDPLLPAGNASDAVNRLESQSTLPKTRYQRAKARTQSSSSPTLSITSS